MNTPNLALKLEQEQRNNPAVAREQQAEKLTNLHDIGSTHAAFGIDPLLPESEEYWQGYQEQKRRFWLEEKEEEQQETRDESLYQSEKLGFLYATCEEIEAVYGDLAPIGEDKDYQGWEIEINGLAIELMTLDWEHARGDRFWNIYSHHPDALKFLGEVFGSWNVTSLMTDEFGDRLSA